LTFLQYFSTLLAAPTTTGQLEACAFFSFPQTCILSKRNPLDALLFFFQCRRLRALSPKSPSQLLYSFPGNFFPCLILKGPLPFSPNPDRERSVFPLYPLDGDFRLHLMDLDRLPKIPCFFALLLDCSRTPLLFLAPPINHYVPPEVSSDVLPGFRISRDQIIAAIIPPCEKPLLLFM